ncbi:hypothetical protein Cadr_000004772 [Camelus dromedarius]|uniref:Uncharacterized protein n=1 Tax=Camelus dromedarius TaxID=9838 RepID=A0A5N4EDP0_CAMDR|nr:hypothetical protein Cadr_000004772 [Camelus dromedarius]
MSGCGVVEKVALVDGGGVLSVGTLQLSHPYQGRPHPMTD